MSGDHLHNRWYCVKRGMVELSMNFTNYLNAPLESATKFIDDLLRHGVPRRHAPDAGHLLSNARRRKPL
jgi:hypothetical protein